MFQPRLIHHVRANHCLYYLRLHIFLLNHSTPTENCFCIRQLYKMKDWHTMSTIWNENVIIFQLQHDMEKKTISSNMQQKQMCLSHKPGDEAELLGGRIQIQVSFCKLNCNVWFNIRFHGCRMINGQLKIQFCHRYSINGRLCEFDRYLMI